MTDLVEEYTGFWARWATYLVEDPIWRKHNVINRGYVRKKNLTEMDHLKKDLDELILRATRPLNFVNTVSDNSMRLFALAFLERLVTMRQALVTTGGSFAIQGHNTTLMGTINDMRGSGIARGLYRGTMLNFFQWTGVMYNSVAMSGGCSTSFLANFVMLNALFHPFDTLRTRYVADGNGTYRTFVETLRKTNMSMLTRGLGYNLVWSGILGSAIVSAGNNNDSEHLPFTGLAMLFAGYPFLTLKTLCQTGEDAGSLAANLKNDASTLSRYVQLEGVRSLYRGFTPFMFLGMMGLWHFPHIWSNEKKSAALDKLDAEWLVDRDNLFGAVKRNYGY